MCTNSLGDAVWSYSATAIFIIGMVSEGPSSDLATSGWSRAPPDFREKGFHCESCPHATCSYRHA